MRVKNKYQVLFFLAIFVASSLALYNWDLQRRYQTLVSYSKDAYLKKINQLETEKDSIIQVGITYKELADESQRKADSILTLYKTQVKLATYYYEKHKAAQRSNDTLTHSERISILRGALGKRLKQGANGHN